MAKSGGVALLDLNCLYGQMLALLVVVSYELAAHKSCGCGHGDAWLKLASMLRRIDRVTRRFMMASVAVPGICAKYQIPANSRYVLKKVFCIQEIGMDYKSELTGVMVAFKHCH